jgi:hypothetical protein
MSFVKRILSSRQSIKEYKPQTNDKPTAIEKIAEQITQYFSILLSSWFMNLQFSNMHVL